jgi:protease I
LRPIGILVENKYQTLEVWYPYYRLQEAGYEVKFIGTGSDLYKSKEGYPVKTDVDIQDITPAEFDGVVIPGGYAPDRLRRYPEINSWVHELFTEGKLVAAICHAAWVLVSAGVLDGKKATCFFAVKDDLTNAGGQYLDQQTVIDGNLITARKPDDLPAFCRSILNFLNEYE